MNTVLVIEFIDYVCAKFSAEEAWRCLNNMALIIPNGDVRMPAVEIDEPTLRTIEQKAWTIKKEPGVNEYITDDVKILHDFCVERGVCAGEAVISRSGRSVARKTA